MEIKKVGNIGVIFQFEDENLVYLINTDNKIFLCDTHEGPLSMECVKEYIDTHQLHDKEIILFNSHSDFDHIWGNCAFENATIIGHEKCRKRMKERGEFDLDRFKKFHNGNIELKLPNLTFNNKITFEEEKVEFIYAPGHTICSSICFNRKDSVLYVGDLVEGPIPVILYEDLETYIKTLEFIKSLSPKVIISSHSGIVDENLIDDNIQYIKNIQINSSTDIKEERFLKRHNHNIKNTLILKYENIAREKSGEKFDFKSYKCEFWKLLNVKYEDLEQEYLYVLNTKYEELEEALKSYVAKL